MAHALQMLVASCVETATIRRPRDVRINPKSISSSDPDRFVVTYDSVIGREGQNQVQTRSVPLLQKQIDDESHEIRATCLACKEAATLEEVRLEDFYRHPKSHDLTVCFRHINRSQDGGKHSGQNTTQHTEKASALRKRAEEQSALIAAVIASSADCVSHKQPRKTDFFATGLDSALQVRYIALEYSDDGQVSATGDYCLDAKQLKLYATVESAQVREAKSSGELLVSSSENYRLPTSGAVFKAKSGGGLMVKYLYEPARVRGSPGLLWSPSQKQVPKEHLRRLVMTMPATAVCAWAKEHGPECRRKLETQEAQVSAIDQLATPPQSPMARRLVGRDEASVTPDVELKPYPAHHTHLGL